VNIAREACTQLDNYFPSYKETNASELVSFIQKAPSSAGYLDDLGVYNGRGLYQFDSYDGGTLYTLGAFSDGKIYKAGASTWGTAIHTGLTADNHIEFAHYSRRESKDTVCIMTDGSANMIKWNTADAATTGLYNKSGEPTNTLTGTITFTNGSDQVTGASSTFNSGTPYEVRVGDYIRCGEYEMYTDNNSTKQREAIWYKVYSIESDTALTLEGVFTGETIVAGATTKAQVKVAKIIGTLTFTNNSTAVTGSGTNFDPEVLAGQWIRKTADGRWYEVASVTNDTALVLRSAFKEATGAGTANESQKAPTMRKFRFVKPFDAKGHTKMIYACDITNSDYGFWMHSSLDDPEDVPTLNFDRLMGSCLTGYAQVANWAVLFTSTTCYIYKYLASKDEFIRIGSHSVGCISSKSIKELPGACFFLSSEGLYKLSVQEGLVKVSQDVQLELDGVNAGALNKVYYTASGSQNYMPQAAIDYYKGWYFLSYPLAETKNSYLLVYDYINGKWFRMTSIYAASLLWQRVSGAENRLVYQVSNSAAADTANAKYLNAQTLANSTLVAGAMKFGYWSLPREDGSITNKNFINATLKVMLSSDFNGSISLNHKTDWDVSGSGKTTSSGTLTNTTAYQVKNIVYPINQNAHAIQFTLSDSITAGGYAIIGLSIEVEDSGGTKYNA